MKYPQDDNKSNSVYTYFNTKSEKLCKMSCLNISKKEGGIIDINYSDLGFLLSTPNEIDIIGGNDDNKHHVFDIQTRNSKLIHTFTEYHQVYMLLD